jgi:hypothetical protein
MTHAAVGTSDHARVGGIGAPGSGSLAPYIGTARRRTSRDRQRNAWKDHPASSELCDSGKWTRKVADKDFKGSVVNQPLPFHQGS